MKALAIRLADRVGIVAIVAIFVLPWLWMASLAFKSRSEIFRLPPQLLFPVTGDNFYIAFLTKGFDADLANTFVVAGMSASIAMLVGVPAAFAISRSAKKLDQIFFFVLTTRMLPPIAIVLPLFLVLSDIGLVKSVWGIVLVHSAANVSLVVLLMRSFFDRIPLEVDEAAQIDGASIREVLIGNVIPLAVGGVVLTGFVAFLLSWNEFFFASVLTTVENRTLTVAVPGLVTPHGTYWGQVAAVGTVATIPSLIGLWLLWMFVAHRKSA
uniref:Carbohydrate ABC transporter membrane protein 2, CUT1 family n=1 Tax=Candidatus Kentrum sp. DK TaxID=2126562 RepID=A0A450SN27_9GAMM|nr:MAG: carbohydrate ABC transporter membrane protein 2, CUT1 family [Candidatus Kentron sp. DK]